MVNLEALYYRDLAIVTIATVKTMYHLVGQQCQEFLESIFELMELDLPVSNYSTLSRRLTVLAIPRMDFPTRF